MVLHGHSKIELTNVHTGEVEVVEQDNIVTNAVQDLLKTYGIYYPSIFNSSNYMPYRNFNVKSCYGGIIAWDGKITEDKDNYRFKPYGVNAGAHAAYGITNSSTDNLLGSYNAAESEITEDHAKFVYDFSTNQGNGTIECITLVSNQNGYVGFNGGNFGSMYGSSSVVSSPDVVSSFSPNMIPFRAENKIVSVDKLTNKNASTSISLVEYDALLSNTFSLFKLTSPTKKTETTFSASDLCDYSDPMLLESNYYPIYYDESTNTVSIAIYNNNYINVTEITIATINILTKNITKKKVNVSCSVSQPVGFCYKNYLVYGAQNMDFSVMNLTTGEIKKMSLYTYISSSADYRTQIFPLNEHEVLLWSNYSYSNIYVRTLVNLKDGIVKNVLANGNGYCLQYVSLSYQPACYLYFGTINNLETPVVKTSDKTMKITYTLTES